MLLLIISILPLIGILLIPIKYPKAKQADKGTEIEWISTVPSGLLVYINLFVILKNFLISY